MYIGAASGEFGSTAATTGMGSGTTAAGCVAQPAVKAAAAPNIKALVFITYLRRLVAFLNLRNRGGFLLL
jgi:hypothetical protein